MKITRIAAELTKRRGRPTGTFLGYEDGTWEYTTDATSVSGVAWWATLGLSRESDGKTIHVERATEYSPIFTKALRQMIVKYPELNSYVVKFDGPWFPVGQITTGDPDIPWQQIEFFHGTSTALLDSILKRGLLPRSESGSDPSYGTRSTAPVSRSDSVSLTTQMQMAKWAARDAARVHGGEPVVLKVSGIKAENLRGDMDSGTNDSRKSLETLGSVEHIGAVAPEHITPVAFYKDRRWQ